MHVCVCVCVHQVKVHGICIKHGSISSISLADSNLIHSKCQHTWRATLVKLQTLNSLLHIGSILKLILLLILFFKLRGQVAFTLFFFSFTSFCCCKWWGILLLLYWYDMKNCFHYEKLFGNIIWYLTTKGIVSRVIFQFSCNFWYFVDTSHIHLRKIK